MAKQITITDELVNQWREEFEKVLQSAKVADGKINFSRSLGSMKRPCTVYFAEIAWLKMQALIRECDKEVGWHGIAYRGEDPDKDEYVITDILVYPQEVAAAVVNTDQVKYQTWLDNQDDEVFNNIRMQGHSHVNMGVTPSATDNDLYESLLGQLEESMFYIFMIYNKRGECTYKIYDMAKNVMFETSDVTVKVIEDDLGVEKFLRESKEMIKEKSTYVPPTYAGGYSNPYQNPGYYGYIPPKQVETVKPVQQIQPAKKVEPAKDTQKQNEPQKKQSKGWRRAKKEKKSVQNSYYSGGYYHGGWEDDIYGYYE